MKLKNSKIKYLILLQPTSPQRTYKDLNKACEKILKNKKADALVSSYELKNINPGKLMFSDGKYLGMKKSRSPQLFFILAHNLFRPHTHSCWWSRSMILLFRTCAILFILGTFAIDKVFERG